MLPPTNLMKVVLAATAILACIPTHNVQAATLFVGSSRGTFGTPLVDPSIDAEATFRTETPNLLTELFFLGEPGPDSTPNQLSFTSQNFSVPSQEPFSIGTLTYRNGQTFQGTNVSSVPLNVSLNLIQPSQTQRDFDYRFTFSLTPNVEDSDSADRLTISENPAPQILSTQEGAFRIELLGFSLNAGTTFTRNFQISEDQSVSSTLFAQIQPEVIQQPDDVDPKQPMQVPEPSLITGFLMLCAALKLRKDSVRYEQTDA